MDVHVLGIYCGSDPELGNQYLKDQGVPMPLLGSDLIREPIDAGRHPIAFEFGVDSFPTYLVIDEHGNLVGRFGRIGSVEQAIINR